MKIRTERVRFGPSSFEFSFFSVIHSLISHKQGVSPSALLPTTRAKRYAVRRALIRVVVECGLTGSVESAAWPDLITFIENDECITQKNENSNEEGPKRTLPVRIFIYVCDTFVIFHYH